MAEPWTDVFYRAASMLAGLLVALALVNAGYDAAEGLPFVPIVPFVLAGTIWLLAWIARAAFDRQDSVPPYRGY